MASNCCCASGNPTRPSMAPCLCYSKCNIRQNYLPPACWPPSPPPMPTKNCPEPRKFAKRRLREVAVDYDYCDNDNTCSCTRNTGEPTEERCQRYQSPTGPTEFAFQRERQVQYPSFTPLNFPHSYCRNPYAYDKDAFNNMCDCGCCIQDYSDDSDSVYDSVADTGCMCNYHDNQDVRRPEMPRRIYQGQEQLQNRRKHLVTYEGRRTPATTSPRTGSPASTFPEQRSKESSRVSSTRSESRLQDGKNLKDSGTQSDHSSFKNIQEEEEEVVGGMYEFVQPASTDTGSTVVHVTSSRESVLRDNEDFGLTRPSKERRSKENMNFLYARESTASRELRNLLPKEALETNDDYNKPEPEPHVTRGSFDRPRIPPQGDGKNRTAKKGCTDETCSFKIAQRRERTRTNRGQQRSLKTTCECDPCPYKTTKPRTGKEKPSRLRSPEQSSDFKRFSKICTPEKCTSNKQKPEKEQNIVYDDTRGKHSKSEVRCRKCSKHKRTGPPTKPQDAENKVHKTDCGMSCSFCRQLLKELEQRNKAVSEPEKPHPEPPIHPEPALSTPESSSSKHSVEIVIPPDDQPHKDQPEEDKPKKRSCINPRCGVTPRCVNERCGTNRNTNKLDKTLVSPEEPHSHFSTPNKVASNPSISEIPAKRETVEIKDFAPRISPRSANVLGPQERRRPFMYAPSIEANYSMKPTDPLANTPEPPKIKTNGDFCSLCDSKTFQYQSQQPGVHKPQLSGGYQSTFYSSARFSGLPPVQEVSKEESETTTSQDTSADSTTMLHVGVQYPSSMEVEGISMRSEGVQKSPNDSFKEALRTIEHKTISQQTTERNGSTVPKPVSTKSRRCLVHSYPLANRKVSPNRSTSPKI